MPRKRVIRLSLLLALVAAVGGATIIRALDARIAPTHVEPQPFEGATWAGGGARSRIGIGKHLVESRALVGRPLSQLTAMLGTPARSDTQIVEWYLGQRKSGSALMFPYKEYLVVRLDQNGVACDAAVHSRD